MSGGRGGVRIYLKWIDKSYELNKFSFEMLLFHLPSEPASGVTRVLGELKM